MQHTPAIVISVAGPLRVTRNDGSPIAPRSAKAQGLLVLVASAPGLRRSRAWLQDKLWSDRGPDQAAASMRQTLADIRRAWGGCRDCLVADAGWIGLDPDKVGVQIAPRREDLELSGEPPEFAEGLDVRDPEFEDWIRDQRSAYAERFSVRRSPAEATDAPAGVARKEPGDSASADHSTRPASPTEAGRGPRRGFGRVPTTAIAGAVVLLVSIGVAVVWVPSGPTLPAAGSAPLRSSAMPSVAVLPFDSLGGDPSQQALVTGITRDVVTDLSRFGSLFVVAADTSLKLAQIAAPRPGSDDPVVVRYALTGSVQWLGDDVRVNTQLIETESVATSGPNASTARPRTCSSFRTRSRDAWSTPSARSAPGRACSARPNSTASPGFRPKTCRPTTTTFRA